MNCNAIPKVKAVVSLPVEIVLPNCPRSLQLKGGGKIDTSSLSEQTLHEIADRWRDELIRKASTKNPEG